jgi:peptide/nickel transport system substrate-binding protein
MSNSRKWLAGVLALAMLAGCSGSGEASGNTDSEGSGEPKVGGQIIYGSTTELSGDMGNAWWTNNASDNLLRNLIDDYGTVTTDQEGELVENATTCAGIESVANDDGTKTFTVKIKEGLTFNNGDPITAANYVAYALVAYSAQNKEAGAKVSSDQVVGAKEYQNGETNKLSGVRLIDDYTYAISITSDYVPYYFEESYANLSPISMKLYAPSQADIKVADDGDGAYFADGEITAAELDASRYVYADRISAGPYTLKEFDQAALTATLEINPNYGGNFEGQKPHVEKIIVVKAEDETQIDALKTGAIDFLSAITGGAQVNAALDLVEAGGFSEVHYDRNGYGKLMFQCDFGPTQFKEVRHAVAYLLDRNEFANQFCEGYGSVVHGPYGIASWMYKDSKEQLAEKLETYDYSLDKAVEVLKEGGWVYNADGTDYVDGSGLVRYKEVTDEEAKVAEGKDYTGVVTVNGKKLMPLHIEWSSSEGNSVSELLAVMLANGEQTKQAGMEINQNVMSFDDLLNYMYRDATQGEQYGVKTYGMYNLATNFTALYDQSYQFTMDPDLVAQGWNTNFTDDEKLDKLSMDMVYGVEAGDDATYLQTWVDFIDEWNDYLPEVPLYSNVYYDIMNSKIKNLECNSLFDFYQAVVYAYIEE